MPEAKMFSRVVVSGDTVEVYQYSSPVLCGQERKYDIVRRSLEDITEDEAKREDNLYRSRQNLRRLIWCNYGKYSKFVTLTYKETVLDVKRVRRDITTFVQSMRRNNYKMDYVYVLENQKDRGEKEQNEGCLHVHMLIFNDQFLPVELLNKCWKHGSTNISALDHVRNVGAYICKYITKQGVAAFGKQVYGCSNGLKRPEVENFYIEGYSDHTYNGLHPEDVLQSMAIDYTTVVRHDYRNNNGEGCCQIVKYAQGSFKDENIIVKNWDGVEWIS